jgi:DNA (cytosine-5)-methyltransferase 1
MSVEDNMTGTLRSQSKGHEPVVAFAQNQLGEVRTGEVVGTLGTNSNASGRNTPMIHSMQVRRLTPTEAERLQGFPDGWTLVPWRGKEAPDGPRYKALGNSMAVPVMRWIGERIQIVQEEIDATLATTSPQPSLDRQAQSAQARRSDSGLHEENRR